MAKIKHISIYDGSTTKTYDIGADNAQSITYADLKLLRDDGNLDPGRFYRITDYMTETTQTDTRSAGYAFDVIVRADAANMLNENAYAAHRSGDTYFTNCRLEAWKLKYCLDNDTTRFAWAYANGKGVIYDMIDEFENHCPYDFKNIQFKRYYISSFSKCTSMVGKYLGLKDGSTSYPKGSTFADGYVWRFTFHFTGGTSTLQDYSKVAMYGYCHNNYIGPWRVLYNGKYRQLLNDIVFVINSTSVECLCINIAPYCRYMTFNDSAALSTKQYCRYIFTASHCDKLQFGISNNNICLGGTSGVWTIGNNCGEIYTLAYCQYHKLGDNVTDITYPKSYTQFVNIEDGNRYITLTTGQSTSSSSPLRNIDIKKGVSNSTTPRTITHGTVGDTFVTTYQPTGSTTVNI